MPNPWQNADLENKSLALCGLALDLSFSSWRKRVLLAALSCMNLRSTWWKALQPESVVMQTGHLIWSLPEEVLVVMVTKRTALTAAVV